MVAHERASVLHYMYIAACLVFCVSVLAFVLLSLHVNIYPMK